MAAARGISEQRHNGSGPAHGDFIAEGSRERRGRGVERWEEGRKEGKALASSHAGKGTRRKAILSTALQDYHVL